MTIVINAENHVEDDYYAPAEKLFEAFVAAEYELEKIYTVTEGQDSNWKQGTTTGLLFRIVQEGWRDNTFNSFENAGSKIEMDGEAVEADNFTYEEGSLILTLKPEYLKTLSTGSHTVTVYFSNDVSVNLNFTIESASAVPATGESVSSAAIAGVVIILLAGIALGASRKFKSEES